MRGRILLVTGVAIGYVLGTRAGRERYEDIKAAADKFWNSPRVQRSVNQAEDFVKDKAPDVAEFVADGAKKIVSTVSGTPRKAPVRKTTAKPVTSKSSTSK